MVERTFEITELTKEELVRRRNARIARKKAERKAMAIIYIITFMATALFEFLAIYLIGNVWHPSENTFWCCMLILFFVTTMLFGGVATYLEKQIKGRA